MHAYYLMNPNESDCSSGGMSILVSIVAVSTLALTGNIDARTRGSDSVGAGNSAGFGMSTTVCGPDAAHACQTILHHIVEFYVM
jgi:hypothetical protein